MILVAPLLSLLAAAPSPQAPEAEALAGRIEAFLGPFDEAGQLSGTLLVAVGDEVLFERSYGLANREHRVPNRPGTRFCIASLTKPLTVIVATRLMDEGKLAPDDLLEKWIPGFPNGERITIEHLMRHRAGIPHRVTTPEEETVPRTAADMVELAREAELLFEPGESTSYSSAGYSVLARVLELAGGRDYDALLQHHVCEPAGMVRTIHTDSRRILPDRAQPYVPAVDGWRRGPLQDLSFLVGAGSVCSTPRDLFRCVRTLVGGGYGESAKASLVRGSGLEWNGSTNGFRAWLDYVEASDLTVVLTANAQCGANDRIREALPRLVAGEDVVPELPPPAEPVALGPEDVRRLLGVYRLRPGSTFEMTFREGVLYGGTYLLIPTSPTTFFSPQDYARVEAVVEDGEVRSLSWGSASFPRVGPASAPASR